MSKTRTAKTPDQPGSRSPQGQWRRQEACELICASRSTPRILAFGRAYKPVLDKLGLTYTQYIAMVALSEEDDQTVGALGEKMFLESNTLTPILKKLESIGYIRRQRDPADERQVRVSLTPAGRRLLETDPGASLTEATGLGEDFPAAQKTVTTIRDNLLRATQAEPGAEK